MKQAAIAKLATIVKHCQALEQEQEMCMVGKNRVELIKILAIDCAEMILNQPADEQKCV